VVPDQRSQTAHLQAKVQNNEIEANKQNTQDVTTLTQLLNLMDGLSARQKCHGATNRPATLDLALTRPEDLTKLFIWIFPAKRKRFELFKF
jgi:SpoVK/Ycf46/Vps4 family AAA+-type ATPase